VKFYFGHPGSKKLPGSKLLGYPMAALCATHAADIKVGSFGAWSASVSTAAVLSPSCSIPRDRQTFLSNVMHTAPGSSDETAHRSDRMHPKIK